jgi:elongation factor 1-gamma
MVFGKIYTYPNNPRVQQTLVAAKYNGLDIEVVPITFGVDNKSPEFLGKFPLGKVPAFEGSDGFCLFESSAIAKYVASAKESSPIAGKGIKEQALISQFIAISTNELSPIISAWYYPAVGFYPVNAAALEKAKTDSKRILGMLNQHLLTRTYLVGERVTLADINVAAHLFNLFQKCFEPNFVAEFVNVIRWFNTITNQSHFQAVFGSVSFCTVATFGSDN